MEVNRKNIMTKTAIEKLIGRIKNYMRKSELSENTIRAYAFWIRRFLVSGVFDTIAKAGDGDIRKFFSQLNTAGISSKSQKIALNALVLLFNGVLKKYPKVFNSIQLEKDEYAAWIALTPEEVDNLLSALRGTNRIVVSLLYHNALELGECCALRIKDLDEIDVPVAIKDELERHIKRLRLIYDKDLSEGAGNVELPRAPGKLSVKYTNLWQDQFIFPSKMENKSRSPINISTVQRAIRDARTLAGIKKDVGSALLRKSRAVHLFKEGHCLEFIQGLLGHSSVKVTKVLLDHCEG